MRERIKLLPLIILLTVVVLLGGLLFGINRFQVSRISALMRSVAETAEEQGNHDRALRFFSLYLETNPDDMVIQEKCGTILENFPQSPRSKQEAMDAYEIVVQNQPERNDLRKKLVKLQIAFRRINAALKNLEILRKADAGDAEIPLQIAFCQELNRNFPEAAKEYLASIKLDPKTLVGYSRLADLYRAKMNNAKNANAIVDKMVENNGNLPEVRLFRARYRITFKLPQIDEDLKLAQSLAPENADVWLISAEKERSLGHKKEAMAYLKKAIDKPNVPDGAFLDYALLQYDSEEGAKALDTLRKGLTKFPGNVGLYSTLALLLMERQDISGVRALFEEMKNWKIPKHQMAILQAELDASESKWQQALETLEATRPAFISENPRSLVRIDYLLGQCYQHVGKLDLELAALRRASNAAPNNPAIQSALANVLIRLNRLSEAVNLQRKVASSSLANPDTQLQLARLLVMERLMSNREESWSEAETAVEEAAKTTKDNLTIALLRVEILVAKKQIDQAIALLIETAAKEPKAIAIPLALATLKNRQGKTSEAFAILKEAESRFGIRSELLLAQLGFTKTFEEAEASGLISKIQKFLDQQTGKEKISLYQGLAENYLRWRKIPEAERNWIASMELNPQDLGLAKRLLDVALYTKSDVLLQKLVENIQQLEGPNGPIGTYGKAVTLIKKAEDGDLSGLQTARDLLLKAGSQTRDWPSIPAARALVSELEGKQEESLIDYLQAISLGEMRLSIIKKTLLLLYQRQRLVEAENLIRKFERFGPLAPELRQLAAELSVRNADPQRALEMAGSAVSPDSKDPRDLVWLAQIYQGTNRPADAVAILKKATQLPNSTRLPWVVLVRLLISQGDTKSAEAVMAGIDQKLEGIEKHLTRGSCLEALGKPADAEKEYLEAVKVSPKEYRCLHDLADFYLRTAANAKAIETLQQIRRLEPQLSRENLSWTRRALALSLAGSNEISRFEEAMKIIEENLTNANPSAVDILAKAQILASRPEKRPEAQKLLEELSQKHVLSPEQGFLLARLYGFANKYRELRKTMLEVLARDSSNPEYIAFFADQLVKKKENTEAKVWLSRLDAIAPSSSGSVLLRAQTLCRQGNKKEALAIVKRFAEIETGDKDAKLGRMRSASQITNQLISEPGDGNELLLAYSEELLRKIVADSASPQDEMALAEYLSRRNRIDEALKVWSGAKEKLPAFQAGRTGMEIVAMNKATPAQYQEVLDFLKKSREKAKDSEASNCLNLIAILQASSGDYAGAETTYKQMVELKPRDVGALNNQAMMLIFQGRNLQEAEKLIDKAMQIAGPNAGLIDTRAMLLLREEKYDAAVVELTRVVQQDPNSVRYYHLAQALHKVGKDSEAVEMMRKAQAGGVLKNLVLPFEKTAYADLVRELKIPG